MISTSNNLSALRSIKAAFRVRMELGRTGPALVPYQFDFEHGQWWVTHKPSGAIWSVVDTSLGVDFEQVEYGDED